MNGERRDVDAIAAGVVLILAKKKSGLLLKGRAGAVSTRRDAKEAREVFENFSIEDCSGKLLR